MSDTDSALEGGEQLDIPVEVLPAPEEQPNTEIPDPVGVALETLYVCPLCGWDCLVSGEDAFADTESYHFRGQHPDETPPSSGGKGTT